MLEAAEPTFADPLAAARIFVWNGAPQSTGPRSSDCDFEDAPEAAPQLTKALPNDDVETVRQELALSGPLSSAELHAARRRFMWDNHPDRRPDWPRDLANRRVALANMLIDRALRDLDAERQAR